MKIELKNTDFKKLYEWLVDHTDVSTPIIGEIIHDELKPQYEEAFLKYKNEKQEFDIGDRVEFGKKNERGKIVKISRLSNGQYRYTIEYHFVDIDEDKNEESLTGQILLTKKNIRKI